MMLNRVYHDFRDWEEVKYNMWGKVKDRKQLLYKAITFTSNHVLYGSYMMRVANEWPISCENALTDNLLNKKAWMGHAACALALKCPEDITRLAWSYLTDEQQFLANLEAKRAIEHWQINYIKSKSLHQFMEEPMLL